VADVRAFRGVRYSERIARNLGNLIAPPYDVTTPHLIDDLRDRDPHNMVHLEHVDVEPGHDPHHHAAELYRQWRDDGILIRDKQSALYLYDHWFTHGDRRVRRRGVLSAVRLAPWSERVVLPHEETFPGPKLERLRRLRAVQANLSPLYLLYRDPKNVVEELLATVDGSPDETGVDPDGDRHELTRITDRSLIDEIQRYFAGQPLYVADGHHRYEAAVEYRDERAAAGFTCPVPSPDLEGAEQFVLALLCAADDPGVFVLPTHRLVRGLPNFDPDKIRAKLERFFNLEPADDPKQTDHGETICRIWLGKDQGLWTLNPRPDRAHQALLPTNKSGAWRDLDLAILSSAVLEGIFGIRPEQALEHISYTSSEVQAIEAVNTGEAQLAFLVEPSTVDDLMKIADAGDRMPPKSTFFWPKVPAGLVIHELC
jgi:uncharacterized protein (DUF1015 family)